MSALADDAPRGFVPMRDYLKLQRKCDELEERLATGASFNAGEREKELEQRVRDETGCTRCQARLVLILYRHKRRLHDSEIETLMGLERNSVSRTVAVYFSHMRKRNYRPGTPMLVAKTRAYQGYALTPEARAWLTERIPELTQTGGLRR